MKKIYKINTKSWYVERLIFLIAGTLTIISTLLAYTKHTHWLILAGFIGLMMIIFSMEVQIILENVL